MKLDFFPLTADYIDEPDGAHRGVIRLFGRSSEGDRVCVLDSSFSAYFWVILEDKEFAVKLKKKILGLKIAESRRTAYATNVEILKKKHLSKDVYALKVEVNNPKDIGPIREEIKSVKGVVTCLETDVPFVRRYFNDRKLEPLKLCTVEGDEVESNYTVKKVINAKSVKEKENGTLDKPKVLGFDIEVYSKRRSPNEDVDPVLMIAFYGSGGYKKVITWKKFEGAGDYVEFVKDEGEMLMRFNDIVNTFGPDYIVGYFSDGFDFPYVKARAEKYKIKLKVGLDGKEVKFSRRNNTKTAKIVGMAHIDVFKFIRRIMSGEINLPSYDLDTVANNFLGTGKSGADVSKLWSAWDKGGKELGVYCKYNLVDAELAYKLFEKIYPNISEFVKLCGLPPDDLARMSFSQLVESFVLRNLDQFNEIAPNRPYRNVVGEREGVGYEGAFVVQPEPGIYRDVAVFDFKSLYPTIISVHNICPSTLTDSKKDVNVSPKIDYEGKEMEYRFSYKYDGFFPKLIREVLVRRNRVKDLLKKDKKDATLIARQYSLKTLANSTYGYFGFSGARWYCKECAASTTAFARDYIKQVIERAEKEKLEVVYGDSVGENSRVWIRNKGRIYETEIKSLFDKVDMKSKNGKEYNFRKGLEVLTLDHRGNSVFKPLVYVMRHKCDKKMYRVNFTNNWSIDVTEDHSLIGYESLMTARGKSRKCPLLRILEVKPEDINKKVKSLVAMKKIPNRKMKSKKYPDKVYEFMGLFIGDGSFQRNLNHKKSNKDYYLRLSLGLDGEELFERNIKPLIELGYIKNYWWSKSRKGDLTINGLKLVKLISKHCSDEKHKKIIPNWLMDETEENIGLFLRGLFTADGTVMLRNGAPIIKFTSVKNSHIGTVRKLLYLVGVSHSVFKENNKNVYRTKDTIHTSGSYSKNIIIKDRRKFNDSIGFLLKRKDKRARIKTKNIQKKLIKDFDFDLQGVKTIESFSNKGYVYDIEVEDTHRFFANYVLVHNTDSVFISLGKGKTMKDGELFLKSVNEELPSLMELELDGFYPRGIFVMKKGEEEGAKKKYALVNEKDEIKIVGFETVRGDWSLIAKETQKEVLRIVLVEDDVKKAVKYVKDVLDEVKDGKTPIEKLILKKRLTKNIGDYSAIGPHVNVAKQLIKRGDVIGAGSEIKYVVQEGKGNIGDRSVPDDEAKSYDPEYYIDNQIIPAVERIFLAVGYDKEDLTKLHKQKSLGDF